jgi:hypothetical protein
MRTLRPSGVITDELIRWQETRSYGFKIGGPAEVGMLWSASPLPEFRPFLVTSVFVTVRWDIGDETKSASRDIMLFGHFYGSKAKRDLQRGMSQLRECPEWLWLILSKAEPGGVNIPPWETYRFR